VTDLRELLEKDGLTLLCQPIRALEGDAAYPMAEILVRMRAEEAALLPPGDFFPVFEQNGMMPALDRWVVRHVVQHLARGTRIPHFTINLSGDTLADREFPKFVSQQLSAKAVAAETVLFEIHESDTLHKADLAARFSSEIKRLGCGIVIDGFGATALTFDPLKTVRPAFLKIDGLITRKVLSDPTSAAKMKTFVRVGASLNVGIIAECVEDQDVLVRLGALGIGYAQGFGIQQPQPIEAYGET
jgi:EAL domain-containing protein (putative c-di-GMP-specific phosphodiesterase class I)